MISLVPNANSIAYRVGKWHQEKMGEWKWGYEDPKPTMISFFNQAGMKNVREYSIGVQHSVHFLNSPQLAPMAKILADFYRGITPHELDVLNQGYLLTTVGKTGTGLKLVVVPNDPLQAYIDAGYPDLTEYFNPLGYFEEVYCLSPWEPVERELFGMKVIPTHPAQFARRVKELGADVVRAYDVIAGRVACDNRVEGIPFIVSVHDIDPNRIPVGGLPTPDYFMAISQAVKDFLIQNGADPQKILPFANRVDVDIFKPITDADQKQAFEALYPGKYRVLFVGRLGSQKNLDNFIKALPYLGKDYQFIIVGKGDKSPYLKMAEEGGVVDQCHFVDAVPNHELAKYYSFSDCMCTPSRREGFGIVFIEAMSSGAVVITSDIPPMNEFITDGESGILIKDYENPAAIADAIRKACEDQTLRAILKENTRKAAFPFSKEAVDQQEITIYQQVVGKKKINIPAIENKHAAASMKQALPDFTVIPLTPDLKDEWDQIVNTSPDAWFYHQYEELQLIDEVWHPLQFNFLVQDKDRILAICPLQWHKGSMVIDSTVMGPAGPAFHKDIDDRERTRVMQFIAAHCKEILQQTQSYGVKAIRFFLPPLSQTNLNSWESMENPLLKFGFKDISTQTRIINLDQDEENIFKGFTKGHRSAIHKAEKFPMDIYLAAGQKDIDDYYRLHVETYTRTGVPPHPKPYFDAIWRYMGTKGTSKIFMGRLNGEVIAGTNIAAFNLASLYWTGAYGKKALEIEAGKLIQWTAIRWAKENGFHWHEVGEVFPQESKSSKLGGLTTYKSGFGGDTHLFIKGFLELE